MPSMDIPAVRVADKIMVRHYTVDRLGLTMRYTVIAGYFPLDAAGRRIPNALGNDTFVEVSMLGEYMASLPSPEALALMAAREPEAQAAMDAHPQAAKFADDYLAQLCLDHYAATVLTPAPEVLP